MFLGTMVPHDLPESLCHEEIFRTKCPLKPSQECSFADVLSRVFERGLECRKGLCVTRKDLGSLLED